jgi:hypothetical protein
LKSVLELRLADFLDIFRYNVTDDIKKKIDEKIIEKFEKFKKVDNFIDEIYNESNEKKFVNENEKKDYLSSILLLLLNYERYFILKKPKNRENNKKEKNILNTKKKRNESQ